MPLNNDFAIGLNTYGAVQALVSGVRVPVATTLVTNGAAVAAVGATTLAVSALPIGVKAGQVLYFGAAVGTRIKPVIVNTSAAAAATVIIVEPLTVSIAVADTAGNFADDRIYGGTSSGLNITSKDVTANTFEAAGWEDGKVTGAGWSIPWSGNFRPTDPAFNIVENAVTLLTEVWIRLNLPGETGNLARSVQGVATIDGFSVSSPSDGIRTATWTFKGRGQPVITKF